MSRVMVSYRVKPELVQENERLVRAVYEELEQTAPEHLRYGTFQLEDRASFLHIAYHDAPGGQNPLMEVHAFQEFQRDVKERLLEGPSTTSLRELGSFRFWRA